MIGEDDDFLNEETFGSTGIGSVENIGLPSFFSSKGQTVLDAFEDLCLASNDEGDEDTEKFGDFGDLNFNDFEDKDSTSFFSSKGTAFDRYGEYVIEFLVYRSR